MQQFKLAEELEKVSRL